jgi:hypothetical protein
VAESTSIATVKKKVKPNPPSQNQRELKQNEVYLESYNIKKKNEIKFKDINEIELNNIETYDEYMTKFPYIKPPSTLLRKFEQSIDIARLLFYEVTGYDHMNCSESIINLRSDDINIQKNAINDVKDMLDNYPPNIAEQSNIRDNYYTKGGNFHQTIQVCGICGIRDFSYVIDGTLYKINQQWINGILRLDNRYENELNNYNHSRVEGYLNLSVMIKYALDNNESLQWSYNNLYMNEDATDANFIKLSKEIFEEYNNVKFSTPENLESNILPPKYPIILYIVPDLVKFSENKLVLNEYDDFINYCDKIDDIGTVCVCKKCREYISKQKRPPFSMCGFYQCYYK